jgi:hypothetical protein
MAKIMNLSGLAFGRLIVRSRSENDIRGGAKWLCECECGTTVVVSRGNLTNGNTQSCGCLHREISKAVNTKHDMSNSKEYSTWENMKHRCTNQNNSRASTYFGLLCKEWIDFDRFFYDMGYAPTPLHSIDRKDNAKGYDKDNCRWATQQEQQNNRTNNTRYTMNGENLTGAQWSQRIGITQSTISIRIARGWSIEDALTIPVRKRKRV